MQCNGDCIDRGSDPVVFPAGPAGDDRVPYV